MSAGKSAASEELDRKHLLSEMARQLDESMLPIAGKVRLLLLIKLVSLR